MSPAAAPSQQHGILRHNNSSSNTALTCSVIPKKQVKLQVQPFMNSSASTNSSHYLPSSSSLSSPSSSSSSSSSSPPHEGDAYPLPLVGRNATAAASSTFKLFSPLSAMASIFRSLIPAFQSLLVPSCHWLAVAPNNRSRSTGNGGSCRKRLLTGTFFGLKKGRVSFAVQETPRSEPILLLELATPTSHLVKEMASGTVRILLECERNHNNTGSGGNYSSMKKALLDEPIWTMYCNGHKLGYATARDCTASDFHVLRTVQSVSMGAGVMPAAPLLLSPPPPAAPPPNPMTKTGGPPKGEAAQNGYRNIDNVSAAAAAATAGGHPEIMYMRAKFDRVIGSRDSEALYMINPDSTRNRDGDRFNSGGPELSVFLLRI